ncbi:hypothetical protein [Bacillus toyonensis]|uniref:hypothetical protein n=1 Tax=Bacillus toyonensis TaxID=155322 RepID=UPI002E24986A|nr:hypothetical protein [Bacillus toyonensis]
MKPVYTLSTKQLNKFCLELFMALIGSQNYNIHTIKSDADFKVIGAPTKHMLYTGKNLQEEVNVSTGILAYKDLRDYGYLLSSSNINFVETLFSTQIILLDERFKSILEFLLEHREQIARMNIPHLFNSSKGMANRGFKEANSKTEWNKSARNSLRVTHTFLRYAESDFNNYESALYFTGAEREKLLLLQDGSVPFEEYAEEYNILQEKMLSYGNVCSSFEVNSSLKEQIEKLFIDFLFSPNVIKDI